MVQHLVENRVQQMMDGDRNLAHTICEVMADAIDYPLFHNKKARCDRQRIHDRNLTVAPSFQHLVDMNIFVAQRPLVGNGLEYGLAPQFAATILEPPRFNVPEPPLRYMYAELTETIEWQWWVSSLSQEDGPLWTTTQLNTRLTINPDTGTN